MPNTFELYLASQSPRRVELLKQLGVSFKQLLVDVDEGQIPPESASEYVLRIAEAKAKAGFDLVADTDKIPVLGADTCIEFNGEIITKPTSCEHATEILSKLSGQTHSVLTAISLCVNGVCDSMLSESRVTFAKLSPELIKAYVATGEGADKAAGYAIQGRAASFIERIEGSYTGIVGLPLNELRLLYEKYDAL
jgi:septum formation protein